MLVFSPNLVDIATSLTPSSQDLNWPALNLKNTQLAKVWRTFGSNTTESVVIRLNAAVPVNAFLVASHSFDGTETSMLIQANATNSWGSPAFSAALTVLPGQTFGLPAMTVPGGPYLYWRFVFTKASSVQLRQVGRLYLGVSTDTVIPPDYDGLAVAPVDLTSVVRSIGGQRFTEQKAIYNAISLKQSYMPATLYATLSALYASVGIATPFFLQVSTIAPLDKFFYVAFSKPMPTRVVAFDDGYVWGASLDLEELL